MEIHAAHQRRLEKSEARIRPVKAKAKPRPNRVRRSGRRRSAGRAVVQPQVLNPSTSLLSRLDASSNSLAELAMSSVDALCSSAAAETSSLLEA